MLRGGTGVVLLVVALVLAGCSGSDQPPAVGQDSGEIGVVAGIVVTDEQTPAANATVGVLGDGGQATLAQTWTDDAGRFRLEDVPAGGQRILVQKPGFLEVVRDVDVAAGQTTELELRLEPVDRGIGHVEVVPLGGMIACGISTPLVTATWSCGDDNHKAYVAVNVTRGVAATVHETVWESSSALTGQQLLTRLYVDGAMHDRIGGPSPLVRTIDGYDVDGTTEIGEQVYVNFATVNDPLVVAYQQTFTTYFSVFYHQSVPDGYTALAP